MRAEDSAYWDKQAIGRDNVWKRRAIAERIFRHSWLKERVLEIGVGMGTIAAAIKVVHLGNVKYIGTDVSPKNCEYCRKAFQLNVVNTDILDLPRIEYGFTRVLALDTLEHVRLEEREQGFKAIGERLAEKALVFINIPLNPSQHDPQFDFKFDMDDVTLLCQVADLRLKVYEEYRVDIPDGSLFYGWTILERGRF